MDCGNRAGRFCDGRDPGLDLDIRFIELSQARLPSSILLCSQHSCTI